MFTRFSAQAQPSLSKSAALTAPLRLCPFAQELCLLTDRALRRAKALGRALGVEGRAALLCAEVFARGLRVSAGGTCRRGGPQGRWSAQRLRRGKRRGCKKDLRGVMGWW